jgi:energy-coupling factor transporter ATP-binding protein EcfA2
MGNGMMMVEINDFKLRYHGSQEPALVIEKLEIVPGECVLISGPTGSGKTTLLRSLAGLIPREHVAELSGEALVKSEPLERVNRSEFAARVGILFQNPDDQITSYTAREEINFGLENIGYDQQTVAEKTAAILLGANLSHLADQPLETLSGGQKQRVATAALLALQPDLLLLDEPVSNLDPHGRKTLIALLQKMKEQGRTIVICSHELEDLLPLADRILYMDQGKLNSTDDQPAPLPSGRFERKQATSDRQELLRLASISHSFKNSEFSLGEINLTISAGERIALLGPNGSGKSTLISLLAGLLKAQAGDIFWQGKRIKKLSKFLKEICYVSQNPDLMLHCNSVEEELGSRPRNLKIEADSKIAEKFRLVAMLEKHPFSLSQGQRQRLAVAAATAAGGRLILVDEPTTGQDLANGRELLTQIADFGAASILFSSHNFALCQEFAERAIIMDGGKIIYDGPFAAINKNPQLLRLLARQEVQQ